MLKETWRKNARRLNQLLGSLLVLVVGIRALGIGSWISHIFEVGWSLEGKCNFGPACSDRSAAGKIYDSTYPPEADAEIKNR